MNKNEILTILADWNFWEKDLETGILREDYLGKFSRFLSTGQVLIVTGPRRSGKSFLLRQLIKKLISQGIERKQTLMVNFEDPRFINLDTSLLEQIYQVYLETFNPAKKPFIFLDEIQEVKNWEKWVRTMQELKRATLVISGSNSQLLSQELASLLTGRHLDITVFPLSFGEFLNFKNFSFKDKFDFVKKGVEINYWLNDYFDFGSFPKVVLEKEKKPLLLSYFDDVLNRDLIKRYKIRKEDELKSLAKFYFSNPSGLITFSSLEKSLPISADTIEKFSDYLNFAYLTFFLKRFSFRVKEQEKSPRKAYLIDSGLANTVGFRFSENKGKLAENLVFLELERQRQNKPQLEIYYWKDINHHEVDFLIKEGVKIKQLVQVCWDLSLGQTKKREVKSLILAMKELNLKEGLILNESYEGKEKIKDKTISFMPLVKWLLSPFTP